MKTENAKALRGWLEEIGAELGWEANMTEEGDCAFQTANGIDVLVEPHPFQDRRLALTAVLGKADEETPSRLLLACLGLNATLQADGRYCVGYRPYGKVLTLGMTFMPESEHWNADDFFAVLTQFLFLADQVVSGITSGEIDAFGSIQALSDDAPPVTLPSYA